VLIVFGLLALLGLLICGGVGIAGLFIYRRAEQTVTQAQIAAERQYAAAVAAAEPWSGRWRNTTTAATYTIETLGGVPRVTSIVDDNGQDYSIEEWSWDGTRLSVKFRVPATEATVEEELTLDSWDELHGSYVSTTPAGEQESGDSAWNRVEGDDPSVDVLDDSDDVP
jgi:hypothetical protein